MYEKNQPMLPDEAVITKIYFIRDTKVMIDRDLAELYGVETKYLKRQVKRNLKRFPEDFMFQLSKEELNNWRSQFGTSNSEKIKIFFDYLKEFVSQRNTPRAKIGFKSKQK